MISLDLDDRFGNPDGLFRGDKCHPRCQSREGLLGARGNPQPASDDHVVTDHLAVSDHRDEPQAVGVHVGAIVVGKRDRGFEFPRQIGLSIDRLDDLIASPLKRLLATCKILEPEFVIRLCLWRQMVREVLS